MQKPQWGKIPYILGPPSTKTVLSLFIVNFDAVFSNETAVSNSMQIVELIARWRHKFHN